jgi:hypothetical protein
VGLFTPDRAEEWNGEAWNLEIADGTAKYANQNGLESMTDSPNGVTPLIHSSISAFGYLACFVGRTAVFRLKA